MNTSLERYFLLETTTGTLPYPKLLPFLLLEKWSDRIRTNQNRVYVPPSEEEGAPGATTSSGLC